MSRATKCRLATLGLGLILATPAQGCRSRSGASVQSAATSGDGATPGPTSLPPLAGGTPCGEMGCTQFDTPQAAFEAAIAGAPLVVAIGEAHAQKGAHVPSSARRFKETLLPVLKGRASDLLVELMNPPSGCLAQAAAVKQQQEVVTSHQAATDQNEYVAMGEAARAAGIVPDLLRPTCADMDSIRDAGDDAIDVSLATIARLTGNKVIELVDRDQRSDADAGKMVVTYGGSIHHDRLPSKDRESWAFGPRVDARVAGRYVELDLYVPEFIDESDSWRKMPWYPHYDKARLGRKTTVFRPRERAFVLIFASTPG